MEPGSLLMAALGGAVVSVIVFYFGWHKREQEKGESLRRDAEQKLKEATAQAEAKMRAAEIDAKDLVFKAKSAAEKEADQRRAELLGQEKRIGQKEEQI